MPEDCELHIRRCENFKYHLLVPVSKAVPWLKRLDAGLSPRRSGFAPESIHVGFVVDKVALGRFSPSTSDSPANISFHHCSIFIYHRPMRSAIALTKQHTITTSVLSLRASLLTRHIGWKQKQKVKKL
jgi:hypothetical protein